MKRLISHITIAGKYIFKGVVDLRIESSSELFTDTLSATFPRKVSWKGKPITELVKRNDSIVVKLGYDDLLTEVFSGTIRTVKADIPFSITAEDTMFQLKKNAVSKSYPSVKLETLINDIIPADMPRQTADTTLGKFRINNATAAEVLDFLKTKYGIYSWLRNGTLYCGLQYVGDGVNHKFDFNKNIIDHTLEYRVADEISSKVKAISIADDNSRIEVEKGDKEGELRTFHYFDIPKSELETRAEQELAKLKYDGYRGSFTTFGTPVVNHGDTVTLTDRTYPEREGTYIVKSVSREFGQNGYRQTIELDRLWG